MRDTEESPEERLVSPPGTGWRPVGLGPDGLEDGLGRPPVPGCGVWKPAGAEANCWADALPMPLMVWPAGTAVLSAPHSSSA